MGSKMGMMQKSELQKFYKDSDFMGSKIANQ